MYRSIIATLVLAVSASATAQTTQPLVNPAPGGVRTDFLLTDGSVMAQGNGFADWYRLTPDINGSYVNGAWVKVASLPKGYRPDAGNGAVLADGRLVFVGGEYNANVFDLTNKSAIYDPLANSWTLVAPPAGWAFIGDSPLSVLPDGKVLVGQKITTKVAELDPVTLKWTALGSSGKSDFNAEEGWTLMPDGRVLTYDVKNAPNSEIYNPITQLWVSAGATPAPLNSPPAEGPIKYGKGQIYVPPGEVGPGILRPDGTVFATGGKPSGSTVAHTAIYTPGVGGQPTGTWQAGPDFPNGDDAGDNFAALLPSGNVLVEGSSGKLYEFDGARLTASGVNGAGDCLLLLPTGEVLVGGRFVYRAAGGANPGWAPIIDQVATTLTRGASYLLTGRQLNGLSQANAFGDELDSATNYPLVRITNTATGHVVYARTHDHSSMGVATGALSVTTQFGVPPTAETGAATLVVVANGIASAPVGVTIQ